MDVAHKHLNISAAEWDAFMQDAAETMDALRIDDATQAELGAIMAAFRADVVVEDGEAAPKDPGLCRRPPSGTDYPSTRRICPGRSSAARRGRPTWRVQRAICVGVGRIALAERIARRITARRPEFCADVCAAHPAVA